MVLTQSHISILELKRLLFLIKDSKLDICIRFRIIGKLWQTDYMRIIEIFEHGAILRDERNGRFTLISDLHYIMQFELDSSFQHYEPYFHYTIDATIDH
jgi:hypothetical protein